MKSIHALGLLVGTGLLAVVYYYFYHDREKKKRQQPERSPEPNPGNCPDYIYDGVMLYSEEDLVAKCDLIRTLKEKSTVQNLSLCGYDALPLYGQTKFNCMTYVLEHCRYIFIYVSPNFTDDSLKNFQTQMCLLDVIKKNEWRVIPILADKYYDTYCPPELKLLHGLEMWHLTSSDDNMRNYFINKFDTTINKGRERLQ